MNALRMLAALLSPRGQRARLSTFIFHRILAEPDPLRPDEPDAIQFDTMLGWISSLFRVLPVDEAVRRLGEGTLPARAACITFDDGYADNHTLALPLLQKHGLSATFFIASAYVDGGRMWNDTVVESVRRAKGILDLDDIGLGRHAAGTWPEKLDAVNRLLPRIKYLPGPERLRTCEAMAERVGGDLPQDLMMSTAQVAAMRAGGMLVGVHTRNHPIIAKVAPEEVWREFSECKVWLESLLGEPVRLCAYPNGKPGMDYRREDAALLRELGFDAAFSTAWGTAGRGHDPMQLPRFTPWDRTELSFAVRCLRNLRTDGKTV